jgi:hypothetical protein
VDISGTLISLDDYLNTSYSPDMEFRDGVLVERNVGEEAHMRLQALLARDISGTTEMDERPALAKLMVALEANGTKLVLVERLDHLARDLMVHETILADL